MIGGFNGGEALAVLAAASCATGGGRSNTLSKNAKSKAGDSAAWHQGVHAHKAMADFELESVPLLLALP